MIEKGYIYLFVKIYKDGDKIKWMSFFFIFKYNSKLF